MGLRPQSGRSLPDVRGPVRRLQGLRRDPRPPGKRRRRDDRAGGDFQAPRGLDRGPRAPAEPVGDDVEPGGEGDRRRRPLLGSPAGRLQRFNALPDARTASQALRRRDPGTDSAPRAQIQTVPGHGRTAPDRSGPLRFPPAHPRRKRQVHPSLLETPLVARRSALRAGPAPSAHRRSARAPAAPPPPPGPPPSPPPPAASPPPP